MRGTRYVGRAAVKGEEETHSIVDRFTASHRRTRSRPVRRWASPSSCAGFKFMSRFRCVCLATRGFPGDNVSRSLGHSSPWAHGVCFPMLIPPRVPRTWRGMSAHLQDRSVAAGYLSKPPTKIETICKIQVSTERGGSTVCVRRVWNFRRHLRPMWKPSTSTVRVASTTKPI